MDIEFGKLIDDASKVKRDAVHVAVVPVVAAHNLLPGSHVGLTQGSNDKVSLISEPSIGIIDPYLTQNVLRGQWCWLFLYPNTVTGMRHHWSHPAFDDDSEPQATLDSENIVDKTQVILQSEKYLREFSLDAHLDYESVIDIVTDCIKNNNTYVEHNSEYARDAYYNCDQAEFWKHVQNVTGLKIPDREYLISFSCSC